MRRVAVQVSILRLDSSGHLDFDSAARPLIDSLEAVAAAAFREAGMRVVPISESVWPDAARALWSIRFWSTATGDVGYEIQPSVFRTAVFHDGTTGDLRLRVGSGTLGYDPWPTVRNSLIEYIRFTAGVVAYSARP